MIVYFSVLIIICLVCYFDKQGDGKRPLLISVGLIYLMITLQEGWGGDSEFYMFASDLYHSERLSIKELMAFDEDERHGELGYMIMFTIMPSYRAITFVCAMFLCAAIYILLYNFVPRKYWSLFFFFQFINHYMLMGDISALPRNGLAVSLFIMAVYFLSKRKKIPFLIIIVVAAFFHKSVLVFVPFVFIPPRQFKINPTVGVLILLLVAIFSVLTPETWSNIIVSFLNESDYLGAYSHYLDEHAAHFDLSLLIPFIVFWGAILLNTSRINNLDGKDYLFINLALAVILFKLLPGIGMSDRLFFYMDYLMFTGILISIDKIKSSPLNLIVIGSLLLIYGRWFIMFSNTQHFIEHWLIYNPIF